MLKKSSKFLFLTVSLEMVLSIWVLFYFNYLNRLTYDESFDVQTTDLGLLIQNLFADSWWTLIILSVCLATIFSLVCFIYKDLKFQFMAICIWVILFILAIDINDSVINTISVIAIFIPLFGLNIASYFEQKKLLQD